MYEGSRHRLPAAVLAAASVLLLPEAGAAQSTRLIPIQRSEHAARASGRQRPLPSHRAHLQLARPVGLRSRPELRRADWLQGPTLPDSLRVLVLRIDFPPDSDPATTGEGTFDLRDIDTFLAEEGHDIDAAPHDRGFTQRHMLALHHYWWANSDGALSLSADVLPVDPVGAYRMPNPMAWYGFETPLSGIIEAYEELVSDAVAAADAGPDAVDWNAYDAFVLFHAGADWQGDSVGAGDTPADLPTAYIALGSPVVVGGREIHDATIVPETVSQDGFVGGINGVFSHEFGHQLGLPDLYDTVSGNTAVGLFALMDIGDFTGGVVGDLFIQGVLPASVSPWTRVYMGWTDPVDVGPTTGEQADLIASTALAGIHSPPPGAKVVRVRVAEEQAFLVEFRSDDLDGEAGVSLFWNEGVIDGTGTLIGGVKTRTYEYDALLPGTGVMIWHLDREVAGMDADGDGLDNLSQNHLQSDRLRRFLDVEEADGMQQLGWVPGYLGSDTDYWLPAPTGPERFGIDTEPGSDSWTGAPSGLEIEVLDHPSPLAHRVRISADLNELWSASLPGPDPGISVPWMIPADGSGSTPLVAVLDGGGGLFLWDETGGPAAGPNPIWIAPSPPLFPITLAGDALVVATTDSIHFLDMTGVPIGSASPGAVPVRRPLGYGRPGAPEVLVEVGGDRIVAVDPRGVVAAGDLSGPLTALASVTDNLYLGAIGNRLHELERAGIAFETFPLWQTGSEVADIASLQGNGSLGEKYRFAVLDRSGSLYLGESYTVRASLPPLDESDPRAGPLVVHVLPQPTGRLAIGDFFHPAYGGYGNLLQAVLVPTVEGVRGFEFHGPPLTGWPPAPRGRAAVEAQRIVGTPLTTGRDAVLGLTPAAELLAFDRLAEPIVGSIRQLVRDPIAAATIGEPDADTTLLLVVDADSLRVSSLALSEDVGKGALWAGPGGGPAAVGSVPRSIVISPGPDPDDPFLTDFYVYPNPARRRCTIRVEGLRAAMSVHAYTENGTNMGVVARFAFRSNLGSTEEAEWDLSRLAPGVYHLIGDLRGSSRRVRTTLLIVR
jgi:M6 family metalloprotease-like protein